MELNIIVTLVNAVVGAFSIAMFYPLFKSKKIEQLNKALETRPVLAKVVARRGARSYVQAFVYFVISLTACGAIALGSEPEVDMDLATLSVVIVFFITLARVWKLRKLLGSPVEQTVDR